MRNVARSVDMNDYHPKNAFTNKFIYLYHVIDAN